MCVQMTRAFALLLLLLLLLAACRTAQPSAADEPAHGRDDDVVLDRCLGVQHPSLTTEQLGQVRGVWRAIAAGTSLDQIAPLPLRVPAIADPCGVAQWTPVEPLAGCTPGPSSPPPRWQTFFESRGFRLTYDA